MLSLLAGPFTRVMAPSVPALTEFPNIYVYGYDDLIGVFDMYGVGEGFAYSVMQLDGTVDPRSVNYPAYSFVLDQKTNGWCWVPSPGAAALYVWDLQDGAPAFTPDYSGATGDMIGIAVRCIDRYLQFVVSGGAVTAVASPLTAPLTTTVEATSATGYSGATCTVSRLSPSGTGVVICFPNGQIINYDTASKAFTPVIGHLPANIGAWYSAMLNVYVVLTGTTASPSISIYAPVVQPSALSAPTPATGLELGQVTSVSSVLTGSNGEPCAGELVEWSITAGEGALSATQSITDATGTARVLYIAPLTAGVNPTIQAEMFC